MGNTVPEIARTSQTLEPDKTELKFHFYCLLVRLFAWKKYVTFLGFHFLTEVLGKMK